MRAIGGYERVRTDIKGFRAVLERLEGGRDILASPDFWGGDLQAKRAGCCRNLSHFHHVGGIVRIGPDRQPLETGDNLAQEL
jgi:hypothetical protein